MSITRAIPDVRSTNVDKTVHFYTELLGFEVRRPATGAGVAFVSASHPHVEVTLNRDGFALPPGFTVEVAGADAVAAVRERAQAHGVRLIDDLTSDGAQFSMLDPSGRRITVAAAAVAGPNHPDAAPAQPDQKRPITRAIPGHNTSDLDATQAFYVDVLGLEVGWRRAGVMMLRSPAADTAQVMVGTESHVPDGFDLNVGTLDRVDGIHRAAVGNAVVFSEPEDFPEHGIRCFLVLDPNGVGINVYARLDGGGS